MSLRISSAILLAAAVAGCSGKPVPQAEGDAAADGAAKVSVACALSGAKVFKDDCTIERVRQKEGDVLVLHHPDGGFRRLVMLDGNHFAAADGADAVFSDPEGNKVEVTVGNDHYLLPAPGASNAAKP